MTATGRAEIDRYHEALKSGPKTQQELIALPDVNPVKFTSRMRELRVRLQLHGQDWLHRDGRYELVIPR